jgi:hypothetical protein
MIKKLLEIGIPRSYQSKMKKKRKKIPPWEDHLDNNDNESNE